MKTKILLVLTVLAASVPSFALPPPRVSYSKPSSNGPILKFRPLETSRGYIPLHLVFSENVTCEHFGHICFFFLHVSPPVSDSACSVV